MVKEREEYYHRLGIPPGPPTMQGVNGEPESTGTAYTNAPLGSYDVPKSWPTKPKFADAGGPPGPPVQWNKKDLTSDNSQAGDGYTNSTTTPENEEYFYHPDHLGSTSYITDHNGEVVQFACYLPYGEALADEHTVTDTQPYKFSGKELDGETGLYYFGARYYNPKLALWYRVDPLAEKYPNMGGYVYTAANPIIFTDPDGAYILGYKSSMYMREYNQILGSGKVNPVFSLSFRTNGTYSIFSSPNYQSAGRFISQANIPDKVAYNGSPCDPLPTVDTKNGWYPNINGSANANRTGSAVGAAVEWGINGVAGAINSMAKNEYVDIVNTKEAFSMAYNVVMGNNEIVASAFNDINWSNDFRTLMGNGGFDIRKFQADVMNYITDGNMNMVNFQIKGYASDFNQYRTAVYQLGERLLKQPGVNLNISKRDTFLNNAWDTYLYMGK